MKKLFYTLILAAFLVLPGCTSFNSGVTFIHQCCQKLSVSQLKAGHSFSSGEKNKETEDILGVALLPTNSWDGNMLIW